MKILIIEDDLGITELFREELVELNHLVSSVDTFPDADKYLLENYPDLMIVDYSLSSHDNAQDWLKQRRLQSLPIPDFIVSTGQGDERIAVEMMKLGARDYIIKDSMLMTRLPDIVARIGVEKSNEIKLREAYQRIEEQLKFTQLLMQISTSFINLPLTEVESAVQQSLNEISLFVNADQSYIARYDFEKKIAILDYEWCNKGFSPRRKDFNTIPMDKMDNWIDKHQKGEVVYLEDINNSDQNNIKLSVAKYHIKSVIAIPMMNEDVCIGFVSFDSIRGCRIYTEIEQRLFKVFCQLLVNIHNRRQRVEALRLSGEKYQLLFQQNPQPMWIFDVETLAFLEVNDAAVLHYGYSREEFLTMNITDIREKEDIEHLKKHVKNLSTNNRTVVYARHTTQSKQLIEVEMTSSRVLWNERIAIHIMVNDITEKKIAQDKLQEKRDILKKVLIETSQLIETGAEVEVIDYTKLTKMMCEISGAKFVALNEYINNGTEYMTKSFTGLTDFVRNSISLLGFNMLEKKWKKDPFQNSGSERQLMHIYSSIHEIAENTFPVTVTNLLQKTFNLGEVVVVSIIDKDQVIGDFVLLFKKNVIIKNKEIVELFASQVAQFIVRKRTENAMRESESNYRLLFSNNPQPMWIYDNETLAFLEVNEAAIQMYGYTRKEFLSMSILDIRPPEDIPMVIRSVIENKTRQISSLIARHIKKSSDLIQVEVTSSAVEFENKSARHVMINDLTKSLKTDRDIAKT